MKLDKVLFFRGVRDGGGGVGGRGREEENNNNNKNYADGDSKWEEKKNQSVSIWWRGVRGDDDGTRASPVGTRAFRSTVIPLTFVKSVYLVRSDGGALKLDITERNYRQSEMSVKFQ